MTIGEFLRRERKLRKMSLNDLSKMSGLSVTYMSDIERGNANGFEAIQKMLEALGLTMDDCKAAGVEWWSNSAKPDVEAPAAENSDLRVILEYLEKKPEVIKKLADVLRALEGDS